MATIYSVTVCDLDVDDTDSKKPEKVCTLHCSEIEAGIMGCKIFEASEGEVIDDKALFTFDLTPDTDCARLGEKAVIIDLENLNIIVRFQNVNDDRQFRNKISTLRGNNVASVFSNRTEETSASQYFQFYGYLSQQQNMMQDYVRTSTYQKAIHSNRSDFENKVCLDVGAGLGILSFFALEAGAARVYAVEASNMAEHAQKLIETNKRGNVITVIAGEIEEIELRELVDIIISEQMGYMLYNERMLETYLHVKKWLKPGGKMFPSRADLHVAPFHDEALYIEQYSKANFWCHTTLHGVDLSAMRTAAMKEYFRQNGERVSTVRKTCLEATAPLAHLAYEDQLAKKEKELKDILNDYRKAPLVNGYRNKSEFTVGKNANGEKLVGFRLGSYIDGSVEVGDISDLPHIPERMELAAKLCQDFIRASPHDVFSTELYTGVFRQISVRFSTVTDELMVVIGLHMEDIKDEFVKDIVSFFTETGGKELNAKSIYIEIMTKRSAGQTSNKYLHVHGEKYITEIVHGLQFRISPGSFFQVNTQSAEVLYQCAIKLAATTPETSVLDICCGTGTIGLCFSKYCKEVFGVELIADAIEDARYNATANNITNCEFFAGNCDDYIQSLVHKATGETIVAIVDPPRAGLHNRSVAALRNAKGLDRFIYISCAPTSALRNWIDLAGPCSKTYKGNPFVAKFVNGVDMFPHTQHKEMVILFERLKDDASL